MVRPLLFALFLATPCYAVTINEVSGPGRGSPLDPDPAAFTGFGPCGSGGSVINDGCSVAVKDSSSPGLSGRFDPFGGSWIDSQDRPTIVWAVERASPFTSVRFALTDAFDQPAEDRWGGESFFSITAGDATWTIPEREADGTLHWLEILLDAPTTRTELTFNTRLNDGWGVRGTSVSVAPVALPATGLLLLGAIGAMAGLRRRTPAAQA